MIGIFVLNLLLKFNVLSIFSDPLMIRFKEYLLSSERGKNLKAANQNCQQVFSIWCTVSENLKLSALFDPEIVRDEWLDKCDLTPGSKKSYISSLREFIQFLRYSDDIKVPEELCTKMLFRTSRWNTVISLQEKARQTEIRVEDSGECHEINFQFLNHSLFLS